MKQHSESPRERLHEALVALSYEINEFGAVLREFGELARPVLAEWASAPVLATPSTAATYSTAVDDVPVHAPGLGPIALPPIPPVPMDPPPPPG